MGGPSGVLIELCGLSDLGVKDLGSDVNAKEAKLRFAKGATGDKKRGRAIREPNDTPRWSWGKGSEG